MQIDNMDDNFFYLVFCAGLKGARGHKLLSEFTGEPGVIRGGTYYSAFIKFAVFLDLKYEITSVNQIKTYHSYKLLEFLKQKGFKESTLKTYITAIRQVYQQNKHLFSKDFVMPNTKEWESLSCPKSF